MEVWGAMAEQMENFNSNIHKSEDYINSKKTNEEVLKNVNITIFKYENIFYIKSVITCILSQGICYCANELFYKMDAQTYLFIQEETCGCFKDVHIFEFLANMFCILLL